MSKPRVTSRVLQSSCAEFNVVPLGIYQKLSLHHGHFPGNWKISAYNNVDFQTQKRTIQSVANAKSVHVLGLESCKNPKLIKRICIAKSKKTSCQSKFTDCFGENRDLSQTYHIKIIGNFTPVVSTIRWRPHTLKLKID